MAVGQTDIIQLKGIGEKTAKLFYKLNIRTVGELLQNYPRDYETFYSWGTLLHKGMFDREYHIKKGTESDGDEFCRQGWDRGSIYDLFQYAVC